MFDELKGILDVALISLAWEIVCSPIAISGFRRS